MIGIYSSVRDAKYKNSLVAPFETEEQVAAYRNQRAWECLGNLGKMFFSPDEVADIRPLRDPNPQPADAMSEVQPKQSERRVSTAALAKSWLFDTQKLRALGAI